MDQKHTHTHKNIHTEVLGLSGEDIGGGNEAVIDGNFMLLYFTVSNRQYMSALQGKSNLYAEGRRQKRRPAIGVDRPNHKISVCVEFSPHVRGVGQEEVCALGNFRLSL